MKKKNYDLKIVILLILLSIINCVHSFPLLWSQKEWSEKYVSFLLVCIQLGFMIALVIIAIVERKYDAGKKPPFITREGLERFRKELEN